MIRRQSEPAMLPYRDNGVIKYAPNPHPDALLARPAIYYDEDYTPLVANGRYNNEDDEEDTNEDLNRFTATGKPLPAFTPNVYVSMGMYAAPQYLPQRYTDDSIIPVVVKFIDSNPVPAPTHKRRKSLIDRLKGGKTDSNMKVVFMPRRDYLKHFAKANDGTYIGTEPQRSWTLEDLEERFGIYKKDLRAKRGQRGATMTYGLNT